MRIRVGEVWTGVPSGSCERAAANQRRWVWYGCMQVDASGREGHWEPRESSVPTVTIGKIRHLREGGCKRPSEK